MDEQRTCHLIWTGEGPTESYETFGRDFEARFEAKPTLALSTAPVYHGDPERYDPEDLFIVSLALCHAQTYLAICAKSGVRVLAYEDHPVGRLEPVDNIPRFTHALLRPRVTLAPGSSPDRARRIFDSAHRHCFIARSVNFPVEVRPEVLVVA